MAGFKDGTIRVSVSINYIPAISYESGPSYNNCYQYGMNYNPTGSLEEKTIYYNFGSWFKKIASESEFINAVEMVGWESGEVDYEGIQEAYLEDRLDQAYAVLNNAIENNQDIANALQSADFMHQLMILRK